MTLISLLINKLLNLIGLKELAAVESSSVILFIIFTLISVIGGCYLIIKKHPIRNRYAEYTPESVAKASLMLGISDILVGVFNIFVGVLKLDTMPNIIIYVGSAFFLALSSVISVMATKKLEKKPEHKM